MRNDFSSQTTARLSSSPCARQGNKKPPSHSLGSCGIKRSRYLNSSRSGRWPGKSLSGGEEESRTNRLVENQLSMRMRFTGNSKRWTGNMKTTSASGWTWTNLRDHCGHPEGGKEGIRRAFQ
ncbi:hypothetical protein IF2G_09094 [Cordyceps javanica]|nr:hypothetical protein IF2G_09094 [Cordyceps javanica]